ncbi:enoyl-CoA hydratase/isomerase family protein [Phreatobacter sp. AB_2022a]|uniref:enoyl-CoA hydratase/isomerase family protein n=1 Tax=Phreatobacter sp. AB_2022a TaxID=3003134 RepID=UPI002286EFE1|nr:enoyl-CoA hydratase/isomerase family protein [Phreatobacter sp. AB_2022a]MCZ0734120.1 enoyl-CoA hydratase/isomerase family protein [Phreatobacter sp. AB_2022a]
MDQGTVRYSREGAIAHVVFDRPQARNAMTWTMYEQLTEICATIKADRSLRAATFRGAGGKAFIAGTDIAQFRTFASGDDGIAYEKRIEAVLNALETLPVPTLAVVEGWCIGGGLAIAACCDLRIATPDAQFGVPIARTLGNCLSPANYARLVAELGVARTKRILLMAETIAAAEAHAAGFLLDVVAGPLDERIAEITTRLSSHAPVTMRVSKEAIRRILHAVAVDGDDLIRQCYGSRDFKIGVEAFVAKRTPEWTGS